MSGPDPREASGADELASGTEGELPNSPWVWRLAGLLAVVLLAVVAGPDLLSGSPPPDRDRGATPSAEQSDPADVVPPVPAPTLAPLRWATRGDAPDSVFAAAAMQRLRQERPDVDRLLWSGTLDGRDHVALVSYTPGPDTTLGDGVDVAALRVGPDDVLATATSIDVGGVRNPDGIVAAAWRDADGRSRMIVLGRPARLGVQVSPLVDYHSDGSVSRRWIDVDADDGAAVVDLGRHADRTVIVRPRSRASGQNPFLVPVVADAPPVPSDLTIAGSDSSSYDGPGHDELVEGVATSAAMIFDVRDADAKVIWSGMVPGSGDEGSLAARPSGRAALVRLRRHDGPVFQSFVFVGQSGELTSSNAVPVPWSVGDLLPYTFSTYEPGAPLLLLNPSGAGTVTVSRPSQGSIRLSLDATGVGQLSPQGGTGPTFGGARLVVRDAQGHVVLRSHLLDQVNNDGFGSYL